MERTKLGQAIKPTFTLLKFTFALVPIVAGLDKFTNILTNWEQYISSTISGILPFSGHTFMMIVGVIEIIAGIIVLKKSRNRRLYCCRLANINCLNTYSRF